MTDNKKQLLEQLGQIVVLFQMIEKSIERMIFSCMTTPISQIDILMCEISFKVKVHSLVALIKNLHKPEEEAYEIGNIYSEIDNIAKKCHECESRRNQLIHSTWFMEFKSAPELVLRMKESTKLKKGYNQSVESMELANLQKDITYFKETETAIRSLNQKLAIQYKRVHGLDGMGNCFDHAMMVKTIYDSVIKKSKSKQLAK